MNQYQCSGSLVWRPKLSVIIPVNQFDWSLHQSLDSVLKQTFDEIEILLIGNIHRHQLNEHISGYLDQDSRFRFIRSEDGKQSTLRRMGAESANGIYIYFLQPYNLLLPDAFRQLLKLIYETGGEIIGFSGFKNSERFTVDEGNTYYRKPNVTTPVDGEELLVKMMASKTYSPEVSMFIYRRSFLQNVHTQGFASYECFSEDEFYTIRTLCMANRVLSVSNGYCIHLDKNGSGDDNQSIVEKLKSLSDTISKMLSFVDKHPLKEITMDAILQRAKELGHRLANLIHHVNNEKNLSLILDDYLTKDELSQLGYRIRFRSKYPELYNLVSK